MNEEQRMVTEFHRAFAIAIGTSPSMLDAATCALRIRLIQQEFDELQEAFAQQDVVAIAKELADLLYVIYGTAVSCGIEMAPVFEEVHRSNMSKVGVRQRPDGTWIRPLGYSPPRIHPILAAQGSLEYHDEASVSLPAPSQDGTPQVVHEQLLPLAADGQKVRHSDNSTPRMRENLTVRCPRCGKSFVRRSHRKGLKEHMLSLVYLYPFRCQVCANRFRAFQLRVHYVKRTVDQRQYGRLSTQIPTTFIRLGEQRVGEGVVTDISLGGCYLQTVVQLSTGTLLSLKLQTEQQTSAIAVEAAMSELEQERLSQFVHQLLPEQSPAEAEAEDS
jgi:predicted HAD superfamily Cof-like phosphohydrolase